jgi:Alkylmercury lyase
MTAAPSHPDEPFVEEVRRCIYREAAATARVPQAADVAVALGRSPDDVLGAIRALAARRVLILAPNSDNIWSAPPFSAVPTAFRVEAEGRHHAALCIWDALGVAAALGADATVHTSCGDCGEPMQLAVRGGALTVAEGILHFAIPARRWWDNIGFT